jgi:hypothetical protein
MRLTLEQANTFLDGGTVGVMRDVKCMACGGAMRVPPSTYKRAERAAKNTEDGIPNDWELHCDDCRRLLKAS